jgi:hypothetical protein
MAANPVTWRSAERSCHMALRWGDGPKGDSLQRLPNRELQGTFVADDECGIKVAGLNTSNRAQLGRCDH